VSLAPQLVRFLGFAQRIAKRGTRGERRSAWVLLRFEVDEQGRSVLQMKEHHSPYADRADWPHSVGGSVLLGDKEALQLTAGELWHALHEKANGWEGPEGG